MSDLDVQKRLHYALAAVAVIRGLKITNSTMRYNELARSIGLLEENGEWHIRYRTYITDILSLAAAAENQSGLDKSGKEPIEFHRIVNDEGEPGAGIVKTSKIARR